MSLCQEPLWRTYSEALPAGPGYYVYRLWGACWSPSGCLYVGMVGENGPRLLAARLAEHRRTKPWWPIAERIDAADCGGRGEVMYEEARQIAALRPAHNVSRGRVRLPHGVACEAQGWPAMTGQW